MTVLGPGELRARHRPVVIAAIAAVRLSCGFCLALPLSALVAESGVGLRAQGDRALFEGGGYLLLEAARLQGPAVLAALRGLLPVLLLGFAATAACNAALLHALNLRERLTSLSWLTDALRQFPAFVLIGVGTVFAQGALLLVGGIASGSVPDSLSAPVRATLLQAAIWLLALVAAAALGGFSDMVKAALVRDDTTLSLALAHAYSSAQKRHFAACFGWLPYAALFVASAAATAKFVEALDVSRPGAWRVALVFTLHQLVVLLSVALRAAWFAKTLRLTATT